MGFLLFLIRFAIVFVCATLLQGGLGISLLPALVIGTVVSCMVPGVWGKKRPPAA